MQGTYSKARRRPTVLGFLPNPDQRHPALPHGSPIQQRPPEVPSQLFVIPNQAPKPGEEPASLTTARVERTLLSAAFDFAIVLDLK